MLTTWGSPMTPLKPYMYRGKSATYWKLRKDSTQAKRSLCTLYKHVCSASLYALSTTSAHYSGASQYYNFLWEAYRPAARIERSEVLNTLFTVRKKFENAYRFSSRTIYALIASSCTRTTKTMQLIRWWPCLKLLCKPLLNLASVNLVCD